MLRFSEIEKELIQEAPPGTREFYARMDIDLWDAEDWRLRDSIDNGDRASVDHAVAVYRIRKRQLIDLYKQFVDIADTGPDPIIVDDVLRRESVRAIRDSILCDGCGRRPSECGYMKLTNAPETDTEGEVFPVIRALCERCRRES